MSIDGFFRIAFSAVGASVAWLPAKLTPRRSLPFRLVG